MVFFCKCIERLRNCSVISKVIVSDTINQTMNLEKLDNKLEIFSVSKLLGQVISNIITGSSLSELFSE